MALAQQWQLKRAGSQVMKEFTFSGMKVRLRRSLIYRSNQRIQDFIYWSRLQSHMKGHWKRERSFHCFVSKHFFTCRWGQKSIISICNWKKNQIFYMLWQYKLDKKNWFNLWRKHNFVIFNDCQDMLQNVDEIISPSFPIIGVFNQRLTNIEIGFILGPLFYLIIEFQSLKSTWNYDWFWIG